MSDIPSELLIFLYLLSVFILNIILLDYLKEREKRYLLKLYAILNKAIENLTEVFSDKEKMEIFEKAEIGLYDEKVLRELDFQNPAVEIPQDRYSKIFSESLEDSIANTKKTILFLAEFAEALLIRLQSQEK